MKRFAVCVLAIALVAVTGQPAQALTVGATTRVATEIDTNPPETPPLDDYQFDGAIVSDAGCYANSLYQATLGGAHVDLPFTMTMGAGTYEGLWVNASGVLTFDEPDPTYGQNITMSSTYIRADDIIAPLLGQNSVWDFTPDGRSFTPAYYGFTEYDGRTALCATWLEVAPNLALSEPYVTNVYADPYGGTVTEMYAVDDWGRDYSRRNSFQVLIVDRNDIAAGDFDIVFNYDKVQWQSYQDRVLPVQTPGPSTSPVPAQFLAAGWNTAVVQDPCTDTDLCWRGYFDGEITGDGFPLPYPDGFWFPQHTEGGIFDTYLDSSPTGLAVTSTNSTQVGRHIFEFRDGGDGGGDDGTGDDVVLPDGFPSDYDPHLHWISFHHFLTVNKYVALGDSFQSGEGAFDYFPLTDIPESQCTEFENDRFAHNECMAEHKNQTNHCHRSQNAYPLLLRDSGLFGDVDLGFWACSGAKVRDLYSTWTDETSPPYTDPLQWSWSDPGYVNSEPKSQLGRLDEQTAVVTLGIGGNDLGFPTILGTCVETNILRMALVGPVSIGAIYYSCKDHFEQPVDAAIGDLLRNGLYLELIDNIRFAAPYASVIVLGYPRFFPTEPGLNWYWEGPFTCNGLSGSDQSWINREIQDLNTRIKKWAIFNGAIYVDTYDVGDNREICSLTTGTDQWFMNGAALSGGSFHPNELGHQLIFQQIKRTLHQEGWDGGAQIIDQGETKIYYVDVADVMDAVFSAMWPGSDILLELTSPSGQHYSRTNLNGAAGHQFGETFESFWITNPEVGQWTVTLTGVDVNPLGEPFVLQSAFTEFPNEAPLASFTLTQSGSTVHVDASGSTDPDGSVVKYQWNFGDGPLVEGVEATHVYDGAGYHLVSLTITDDRGEQSFLDYPNWIEIPEYEFGGFTGPWAHSQTPSHALAGQPVPIGFNLGKNWGNDIMIEGSPTVQQVSCLTEDPIGEASSALGRRGLLPTYNWRTHQYTWTWETQRSWAGTCQELTFDFNDGSSASLTLAFPALRGPGWWQWPAGWRGGYISHFHPAHFAHHPTFSNHRPGPSMAPGRRPC